MLGVLLPPVVRMLSPRLTLVPATPASAPMVSLLPSTKAAVPDRVTVEPSGMAVPPCRWRLPAVTAVAPAWLLPVPLRVTLPPVADRLPVPPSVPDSNRPLALLCSTLLPARVTGPPRLPLPAVLATVPPSRLTALASAAPLFTCNWLAPTVSGPVPAPVVVAPLMARMPDCTVVPPEWLLLLVSVTVLPLVVSLRLPPVSLTTACTARLLPLPVTDRLALPFSTRLPATDTVPMPAEFASVPPVPRVMALGSTAVLRRSSVLPPTAMAPLPAAAVLPLTASVPPSTVVPPL